LEIVSKYLANRKHYGNIEGIQSDKNKVTCGVPQG